MSIVELLSRVSTQGVELWLEGSRLRFRGPRGALSPELRESIAAQRDELIAALRHRAAASVCTAPLSHNQRGLWFITQEAPASAAYHIGFSARIASTLDPSAIRSALQALTDRHPMLRTTYQLGENGQPVQRTAGSVEPSLDLHDVAGVAEAALRELVERDFRRPFDLETGPVVRASLYTRAAADHVFLLVAHHIAADGWSLGILVEDFWALHAEAAGHPVAILPRAEADYAAFVEWQTRLLASPAGERLAAHWQARLQPPRAQIELPADRPRPPRKSFHGATLSWTVHPDLVAKLRNLARDHSSTLYNTLLAAFSAMLFRLTGTTDLVIGTPTVGRTQAEFARVVGDFTNPVPIRTTARPGMTFRELLAAVRDTVHEALDNQDYPLSLMVQGLQPQRDASRSPFFEMFFALLRTRPLDAFPEDGLDLAGLHHSPYPIPQAEGQFDLALQAMERADALELAFRYSTDLFDSATIERFLAHYLAILEGITANADVPVESLLPSGSPPADDVHAFLAALAARDVRLSLDGDKLRLNAPPGVLDDTLKAELVRQKPALVVALLAEGQARAPLRPIARTGSLPISSVQQRLWFLDRVQPGSAHYNIALTLRLRGTLDQQLLTRALDALVRRHESLRMTIRDDGGNPRAEIRDGVGTTVRVADVSHRPIDGREAEAIRMIVAQAQVPFDLSRGPMAAFLLVKLSADEHLLLICMHHIAADGWSLSVAVREICAMYDAEIADRRAPLAPLAIQYVDFAAWQREQLNAGLLARQLSYWQQELAGAPALLELPTDRPRPPVQTFRGSRRTHRMPAELLEAVKAFSRGRDATLYMALLAGWQVVLARHSGQDDIVVGSPVANRDRREFEALIGCFVNNVVLRGRLDGNPPFADFLSQVKATVLRAFDHHELPFDRLVEAVRPERSTSHTPIFQVMFTLQSFPVQPVPPTGLEVDLVELNELGPKTARYDLTLEMDETAGELRMCYEYATDLFDPDTVDRLHAQYLTLLRQVVARADQAVWDIPLLTADDTHPLLERVNATGFAHDRTVCTHHLIQRAVESWPDAVAVQAEDATLTYAALDRQANQLAHRLRAQGVREGSLVGVCLDRTSQLPVALLAVLKAGAAYVPVDPAHPADRLVYTLLDARVACVVTETRFRELVADTNVPLLLVDGERAAVAGEPGHAPDVQVSPTDLAYVIYTSGSTGRPKGVEIEHRNLVNLLRGMQQEPGIRPHDVLLAVTTPSFDIAGLEIFLPLITGARTVIASRSDVLDGEALWRRIDTSNATIMQATPATWRLLIEAGWKGARHLTALCGGEALPRDLAGELLSRVPALWNMYGPTETTIWSTVHRVTDPDRGIPIGHPIVNTTVYVLDEGDRPAPIGVAGELCLGGEGVARGYRQRPELTAEKFVTISLPGRPTERVYRTGDVVRMRGDCSLEFVGRRDHQVKLRGYRIELGEIEAVLAQHPAVRQAAVVVREDAPGEQRLVAYVVPADEGALPTDAVRTLLRSRLPEYMVPSAIVPLAALPLTPNNKVDRKALPPPTVTRATTWTAETVMTDVQRRIAEIWTSVLGLDRVGLYDNFFDVGGHSLLVIKVHAALRRAFTAEVTVVDLFQRTTIAAQAELVSAPADGNAGLHRAQARAGRQVLV